jgi:pimeloyl-ACP methyl ester carboxylesterase
MRNIIEIFRMKSNQDVMIVSFVSIVITASLVLTTKLVWATPENKTLIPPQVTQNMSANTNSTNIVLVHGGWADGSIWSKVIPILLKAGHKVIAVQLPLHSLADDVATVKRAIDLVGGSTILVGHSYGGIVISNAAYNNPSVKGLVYIAALAPKEGQSISSFIDFAKFPKGSLIIDKGGFVYLNPNLFLNAFQDIDPAQAKILAVTQKPFNKSILAEKSGPPAWNQLPTWYQVSENDRNIPPALEHSFAKQMNATTLSLPSSHLSLLSHPNEIADFILNATKGK